MTIEEAMYALLSGNAGVTAICPADRIKPEGVYQGLARPYIRHFAIALTPIETHSGRAALTSWGYQLSLWADTVASLTSLRTAVLGALEMSANPRVFVTGLVPLAASRDSVDAPRVGQALELEVWYE